MPDIARVTPLMVNAQLMGAIQQMQVTQQHEKCFPVKGMKKRVHEKNVSFLVIVLFFFFFFFFSQ